MTNGMTVKPDMDMVTYDIHVDHTACSGFSNFKNGSKFYKNGPKEAIFHLFKHYVEKRDLWAEDTYRKYLQGHKVIAAMPLVEWTDD